MQTNSNEGDIQAPAPRNVLVVDDHPINRMLIQAMLNKSRYVVATVEGGAQALELILSGYPADALLMDVHMPEMDGYTATRAIRRWEQVHGTPRLPIIALTADVFDASREKVLQHGMDDLLVKPLTREALQAALLRWLPI